MSVLKIIIWWT